MGRIIFAILSACWLLALGDPLPVAATPAAEEQIDPRDITIAIKAELLVDDHVPHERITVKLQDGIVTLDGAVETLLAKRRAVNLVETIRGVHGIVDRITVAPAAEFSDTELVARVTNALANDPATADLRLRMTSRNGTVTLAGKVDSHQEKHLSEMVAAGVQGVQTVTNELTVVHRPRTGDDIEADIVRRWEADPWIDESLLGLIVDQGGSVSLTGHCRQPG